jgi:hypothetical protein
MDGRDITVFWNEGVKHRWMYNVKVEFRVVTTVKTPTMVFWVLTPSGDLSLYRRFGGT